MICLSFVALFFVFLILFLTYTSVMPKEDKRSVELNEKIMKKNGHSEDDPKIPVEMKLEHHNFGSNNGGERKRRNIRDRLPFPDRIPYPDVRPPIHLPPVPPPPSCNGLKGLLTVRVRYGSNLRQADRSWWKLRNSDPYVEVNAEYCQGNQVLKTSHKKNRQHPQWDETLTFKVKNWKYFIITTWDYDNGPDDDLTEPKKIAIRNCGSHTGCRNEDYPSRSDGYVVFDYNLQCC